MKYEPVHEKTNKLHMRKKDADQLCVTAQLISAFVYAWIVQFLFYFYQKFQESSFILWLYSLVCVRPVQNPKLLVFSCIGSLFLQVLITPACTVS